MSIGIDLGTTNSCVATYINGSPQVIADDDGYRTTPSCVAFTEHGVLVGTSAMENNHHISNVKRIIGRSYSKSRDTLANMPYMTTADLDDNILIHPNFDADKFYHPQEISAHVLEKMQKIAQNYVDADKGKLSAVVTIPAYFNNDQRQATLEAGKLAGLNIIRIINEPTAAAIAYGYDHLESANILVFDFGGGTHDVSLLSIDDGVFVVEATNGNPHLGGNDIDDELVKWCAQDFLKLTGLDMSKNKRSVQKLKDACELAKINLSNEYASSISIESLYQGVDYRSTITRTKFESLCGEIFRKTMIPVKNVLDSSNLGPADIDEIIVVGGSTRIPKIRQMLSEYFGGKEINMQIDPDEAVAIGAAIWAESLSNADSELSDKFLLVDVIPLGLGVETAGGTMVTLIPRNRTIPCSESKIFSTYADNQTEVTIQVFEGERVSTADNIKLGSFQLSGISPAPRSVPRINVTFSVNRDGMLQVTASDDTTGNSKKINISKNHRSLSDERIEEILADAKNNTMVDMNNMARIDTIRNLDNLANAVLRNLDRVSGEIDKNTLVELDDLCRNAITFINDNPLEKKDIYETMVKNIQDIWDPIIIQQLANNK